jgi:hypothetical protein
MRARNVLAPLVVIGGAAAGAFLWLRREVTPREHVDLYFADGSMVSFTPGSPEGDRLIPIARRVLADARG